MLDIPARLDHIHKWKLIKAIFIYTDGEGQNARAARVAIVLPSAGRCASFAYGERHGARRRDQREGSMPADARQSAVGVLAPPCAQTLRLGQDAPPGEAGLLFARSGGVSGLPGTRHTL